MSFIVRPFFPVFPSPLPLFHFFGRARPIEAQDSAYGNVPYCSLFTVHRSLFTTHYPLPTAHCSLPTVHCLLFTAHCTLPPGRLRQTVHTQAPSGSLSSLSCPEGTVELNSPWGKAVRQNPRRSDTGNRSRLPRKRLYSAPAGLRI